jgi:formate hydrogenlyase transcriptional activator
VIMFEFQDLNLNARNNMPDQEFAFDSVYLSDLPVSRHRDLRDLVRLASKPTTMDDLFPALALRLQDALRFDVLILGLPNSRKENIRMNIWTAGEALSRSESLPTNSCSCGWAWKRQQSILVQDLATEPRLPISLESLQQLGIRSYYVFPLTTKRHRLGALGFGSLRVVPKTNATLEFLRRVTAIVAQILDTAFSSDGLRAPTDCSQIPPAAASLLESEPQDFDLRDCASRDEAFPEMVGNSAPLQEVLRQVRTVAATDATVLLFGETGTGKELVARAIHRLGPRAGSKFVSINCTAIPTELLESELFGHEKGAFTGAINRQIGRLELADRGTLLLDEIGDLPRVIQPKLLRVLENKECERLGSNRTMKIDVRLIAATNQDLRRSIAEGHFREDLFYRLNVFPIYIPPLRERKSDIPALVRYFVSRYAGDAKKSITTISAEAMNALLNWSWPGNVRELQNLMQRCVILTNSPVLRVPLGDLRSHEKPSSCKVPPEVQREIILQALKQAGGVIGGASGAASRLGIKRTTFYSKMKKWNIKSR